MENPISDIDLAGGQAVSRPQPVPAAVEAELDSESLCQGTTSQSFLRPYPNVRKGRGTSIQPKNIQFFIKHIKTSDE